MVEVIYADFKRAYSFKETFFKARTDTHYLARCLHLGSELVGGGGEFIKGESGKFCNYIVELGLECGIGVCYGDFFECHTESNLCSNSCDRIAACL